MQLNVQICQLDETSLQELLEVAVAEASPDETMPPMPGNPGWTGERRQAFLDFFGPMLAGLDGPRASLIYAITVDGAIAGFIRLSRTAQPAAAETGIWVGRRWRGKGVSTAALRLLVQEAAARGFEKVIADTGVDNVAALGALRNLGAALRVHAEIPAYAPKLDK